MTSRSFFTPLFSLALLVSVAGIVPVAHAAVGATCTDNTGCSSGEWCGDAGTCTDYTQCLSDLGGDSTAMDVCATLRDNATVSTGSGSCSDNAYACGMGSYCSQVDFSCNTGCSETGAPCITDSNTHGTCDGTSCVAPTDGGNGRGDCINDSYACGAGYYCSQVDFSCNTGCSETDAPCVTSDGQHGTCGGVTCIADIPGGTGTGTGTGGSCLTPGTDCTLSSGGTGICSASHVCQQTNTQGSGTPGTGSSGSVFLLNPLNVGNCTPNGDCLAKFLKSILAFVVRIGTIVVILMLVFVGYKFVAARGEPGAIEEARSMLLWTVVGGLILLGAVAIADGILATVQALAGGN